MDNEPSEEEVGKFLKRVIETEEKYAFAKKGQETARREDIKSLLEEFCK